MINSEITDTEKQDWSKPSIFSLSTKKTAGGGDPAVNEATTASPVTLGGS